tara:strand:+ start:561 stop:1469 length:909 start_codon:yes stop_codon:yes gene_type:complete
VFESFDLSLVPRSKRDFALNQQLIAISPYKEFDYKVKWFDGYAAVWIWDRVLQKKERQEFLGQRNLPVFPESYLFEKKHDGLHGFRGLEGYVLQSWQKNKLFAEASWSVKPESEELNWFFQTIEKENYSHEIEWREPEYDFSFKRSLLERRESLKKMLLAGTAVLLIGIMSYQSLGIMRLSYSLKSVETQIFDLHDEKSEVVRLRTESLKKTDALRKLSSFDRPSQLFLMTTVANALANESGNLIEWNYEAKKISAVFSDFRTPPDLAVESLEATGWFSSISLNIDSIKNRVSVEMEVSYEL